MSATISTMLQQLDSQLEQILADWNLFTTVIFLILVTYLIYPLIFYSEPDIHPFLLARQSAASHVRQPGESAIFRSLDVPHGYPLRTGLNVKDLGAPKWSGGRDGDLRDVWKRAVSGPVDNDGKPTDGPSKILSVLGKQEVIEFSFEKLSGEIIAVGQHMRNHGGNRIAVYLPNSVEFLVTVFASAFYGLTPILIPPQESLDTLAGVLTETRADVLVAGAGTVPLNELLPKYAGLKQVMWVVERTSRHMDWNEIPEGAGGKADVTVWHDVIDEKAFSSSDLPTEIPGGTAPDVLFVIEDAMSAFDTYEIVSFSQKNIIAAIGAQIAVLPRDHRLSSKDLLTPLASLTDLYPLTVTLAALFSNTSLALTPVSGPKVQYSAAFQGATPTVVIAGTQTMSDLCKDKERRELSNNLALGHWWKSRFLEAGIMPKAPAAGQTRLIYTYDFSTASTVQLNPTDLHNLRIFTGARIVYAFTDSKVAGAVSQTSIFDYAKRNGDHGHFGPPLSCIEMKLKDAGDRKSEGAKSLGQLVISGPAVVGGEVISDQVMTMTDENTLAYPD